MDRAEELIAALERLEWQPLVEGEHRLIGANSRLIALAKSLDDSDVTGRDALHLVAGLSSMMLRPENWTQPYVPMMNFGGQRTMLPDDLSSDELKVIKWLSENSRDPELRARSFDVLWLRAESRKNPFALAAAAVDAWRERKVSEEEWFGEGESTWRRALSLATRMKMREASGAIETQLLDAASIGKNPVFIGQVVRVLRDFGLARPHAARVRELLADAASSADNGHVRRELLLDQSQWARAGDEAAAWVLVEAVAESWIAEADVRRTGQDGSNMIAGSFFENALQEIRRIPKKFRSERANELIARLPRMIREAGEAGLDEMHAFESDPIDLSEAVREVQRRVTGLGAVEALVKLATMSPFASLAGDRKLAEETLENSIAGLFGSSTYAGDGRKIHSSPGDEERPDGISSNVWERMMTHYEFRVQLLVVGQIAPALEVLSNEHRLHLGDFDAIVQGSGLVPPQNRYLFALGLSLGFNGEFAAALHLLVPQLEAVVRYHLRESGVDTGRIDRDSAEVEAGLSTLMKSEAIDELFEEDLAYEIRALLCGPLGPNLRNRLAHGLLYPAEADGAHGQYLWWFALKLVYLPFYNRLREQQRAGQQANGDSPRDDVSNEEQS